MAKARNKVIGGYLKDATLWINSGVLVASTGGGEEVQFTKRRVRDWQVITEDVRKSAASGIARGIVGASLFGPVGMLAGLSAKNVHVHCFVVVLQDGEKMLLETDDKLYKAFMAGVM